MGRVTDIQAQKNGRYYSIFVDGHYAFSLGDLELSASALRVGSELTDDDVAGWRQGSRVSKVRSMALRYLAIRPRSVRELQKYLERKEVQPEPVAEVIEWLGRLGYLDDADFARRWADYRRRAGHYSDARIRAELRQKGVDEDILAQALDAAEGSEDKALRQLIAKRRGRYADEQKLIQYLARQGYSWSQVKRALEEPAEQES